MTVAVWRGPGGTSSHPKSGDFAVASNWSGGVVPDGSTHAILAAGNYAVTYNVGALELASLDIGAGVTLTVDDQKADPVYFVLKDDSTNAGRFVISGSAVFLDAGVSLVNFGELYGANGNYLPSIQGEGKVINDGLVAGSSGQGSAFLAVAATFENESDGVVNSRSASHVIFAGDVQNNGLFSAIDGGVINFTGAGEPGNLLNLGEGVLTGGHWSAIGANSTLNLYNGPIEQLSGGAVVTLTGPGSAMGSEDAGGVTQIETSLRYVDAGSELHILGGRDYATGQDLDISGLLEIGGGTISSDGMTVHDTAGSQVVGYGLITSNMDMYGVLRASSNRGHQSLELSGDNNIHGSLLGNGMLEISAGVDVLSSGARVLVKALEVHGSGVLHLTGDLTYKGKFVLDDNGVVNLGDHTLKLTDKVTLAGGEITGARLQLDGGQVAVTGSVYLDADVRNDAEITLKGASQVLQDGDVSGAGAYHIGGQSFLTFTGSVSSGQTVYMDGASAQLELAGGNTFKGTVAKFGVGDALYFDDVLASGATLTWKGDDTGGRLTVANGVDRVSIHLEGDYHRSDFHLGAANNGASEVTYGAAGAAAAEHDGRHWDAHGELAI